MNKLRGWSYMMMWQIQDGGRPPSWISIFGHNFGVDQHFCTEFCTEMENRQPKGFQFSEIRFSKIQDGGRPPSWIWIFGYNFGINQHFCAKFVTVMENRQPNGSLGQKSDFRKSKMADGRHVWFRFWAIISASINILHQIWHWDGKSPAQGDRLLKIRFSKIQDGGRPPSWISISAHNSASSNIFAPNLAQWWKSTTQGDLLLRIKLWKIQDNRRPPSWI